MEFLREPFRKIKNRTQSHSRSRSKGTTAPNGSVSKPGEDDAYAHDEEYGLLLLNPDSEAISAHYEKVYEVDVVAVHGLGGRRLKTWRNDRGEIWLQKWLPDSIPGARVYTYGYDSDPIFSDSKLGIEDFARGLLDDLTHRSGGKQARRLIFVCHSLGGIVCKRALLMARENPHYLHIYEQTLAILFFGTPHRGAEKADLAATVAAILNASEALTRRPALRKDLIGTLQPHSWYLENISESFSHRIRDFEIVTFYEGHSLPPYKDELVPRSSAFIHDEIKIPMNGDHHQICKFATETCYEYQKVVQNIQRILDKLDSGRETPTASAAPTRKGLRTDPTFIQDDDDSDILSTIDLSDTVYYKENLPRAVDGTCTWLVEDAVFLSWLNQKPSNLLWINGHPGCGKSMLAAFMVDYLKSKSRIPATVCYFFIVENIDHQNNSLCILRSVIAQFLRQRRDLIHHARKFVKRRQLHRLEVMWDLFVTLIGDASAGITTLIIDALDECDEESRNQLLRFIGRIFDRRSSDARLEKAQLKLVITSRRDPSLGVKLSTLPIIRLELENHKAVGQAIGLYIHAKVAEVMRITGYSKDTATFIETQLQVKAENTYLWVRLVFENMERAMSERGGASIKDFQEIVKSLPLEVQSLYASILHRIRNEERSHAFQLLQIITMAFRPLTINELNIMVQLLKWHSKTLSELDEETQGNFERSLDSLRGFVRVADSKIYLIHQSAREFLTRISERPVSGIVPDFSVSSADAHLQLADACISFLMLREFEQPLLDKYASHAAESSTAYQETHQNDPLPAMDNDDGEFGLAELFGDNALSRGVEHVAYTHPFFDYAALNWAKHFTMCETIAPPELLNRYILISTMDGTHRLMNWLRYLWYLKIYEPCPEYFNPLIVAAYFGHGKVLRRLLETCGASYSLETKNLAISWASRMGHAQVLDALLAEGADASSTVGGWTPLAWAANFGNLDAVRVFKRFGIAFLNLPDWKGRTPLSLAAAGGYLDIVKELSSLEGILIDIPDVGGVTPLFKAVTEGHFEIVLWMLQDGRSNVNHQDRTGQTMLFSAAEYGFEDIVQLLLSQERLNPAIRDNTGRSALSWAAAKAPLGIVQMLARDKRADLHSIDHLGRNALCWSCWSSDARVLEFLTAIDPHNVDLPASDDGCTPLHFLVVAGRVHAVYTIRTLLATGSVNVNSKDYAGRTALSHAASAGRLELVQLLVENGADMDLVDIMGMTPLDWGLSVKSESVVQYLESRKR